VVTVWAVWCEPCRKELPVLDALARERDGTVAVVGLNHGDEPARARAFLDDLGVTFPSWRDPDGRLVTALGVGSLPATFVVDASGAIVWRRLGVVTPDEVQTTVDAVTQP
jgi:thiol-disulfide isomerase/thioredoxin